MLKRHSSQGFLSLHNFRIRLARPEALPELTLLGLITGILAGGLLIVFRELIVFFNHHTFLPGDEGFGSLEPFIRFLLPIVGAVVIILLIGMAPPNRRSFGITHVIDYLNCHRGRLPLVNLIVQFMGALVALLSGFSIGREGPAVHMGAGAGSILGQKLKLPDNTLRALAGCGSAAAISASFNTPMAGVIFAMEVIMREYSLGSFIPVMTASVAAALMSQMMYGPEPAFIVPAIPMVSLTELGVVVLAACFIGLLAAIFIKLNLWVSLKRQGSFVGPIMLAGLLMGISGVIVPEVMGIGYETINAILEGQVFDISFLLGLVFVKLCITAVVIGLGIPGGVIGPSLFIGAAAGAMLGIIGARYLHTPDISTVYHALIGMVAMMAAVLQAPLAALVTVLEMTKNPHIIMPAMLAIIIACLISSQVFKQHGLFVMQLKCNGQVPDKSPLEEALSKMGVAGVMNTAIQVSNCYMTKKHFQEQIVEVADWVVFDHNSEGELSLVNTVAINEAFSLLSNNGSMLDLATIPEAIRIKGISIQASLDDAIKAMDLHSVDALYIETDWKQNHMISGVVTRQDIESLYS